MEIPSLKKSLIQGFCGALSLKPLKSNNIAIVTTYGIISGEPYFVSEVPKVENKEIINGELTETGSFEFIAEFIRTIESEYQKQHNASFPLVGNDGYILLKNATIKNSTSTQVFNELIVFIDEIIGISFVSK
jgi:hypothetical protein